MNDQFPLITIGVTCFNASSTINRALESAFDQDYPNLEIVIVDDCSNDGSVAIINKAIYKKKNARLIIHDENKGVSGARNSIIDSMLGELVAFFDDDDISRPQRVSIQYKTICDYERKNAAALLACWGSGCKQYDNGYRRHFKAIGSQPKVPVGDELVRSQLYMKRDSEVFFGGGTPACSMMLRKSVCEQIGPFDELMRRTEDTDFAIRLGLLGGHFIGCREEVIVQTATIDSDKSPEIAYQSEAALIDKYRDVLNLYGRYRYARTWVRLRYHHFSGHKIKSAYILAGLFLRYPSWTWEQFKRTGPARFVHERRMNKTKYST